MISSILKPVRLGGAATTGAEGCGFVVMVCDVLLVEIELEVDDAWDGDIIGGEPIMDEECPASWFELLESDGILGATKSSSVDFNNGWFRFKL